MYEIDDNNISDLGLLPNQHIIYKESQAIHSHLLLSSSNDSLSQEELDFICNSKLINFSSIMNGQNSRCIDRPDLIQELDYDEIENNSHEFNIYNQLLSKGWYISTNNKADNRYGFFIGNYVDESSGILINKLIWYSADKTLVLDSKIIAVNKLSLYIIAPSVIISNITFENIASIHILSTVDINLENALEVIYTLGFDALMSQYYYASRSFSRSIIGDSAVVLAGVGNINSPLQELTIVTDNIYLRNHNFVIKSNFTTYTDNLSEINANGLNLFVGQEVYLHSRLFYLNGSFVVEDIFESSADQFLLSSASDLNSSTISLFSKNVTVKGDIYANNINIASDIVNMNGKVDAGFINITANLFENSGALITNYSLFRVFEFKNNPNGNIDVLYNLEINILRAIYNNNLLIQDSLTNFRSIDDLIKAMNHSSIYLGSDSRMNLGSIDISEILTFTDILNIQQMSPIIKSSKFTCSGCLLIVRGHEDSSINIWALVNQVDSYKKEQNVVSSKYQWQYDENVYKRKVLFFRIGSRVHDPLYTTSQYKKTEEHHQYGKQGTISINGNITLSLSYLIIDGTLTNFANTSFAEPVREIALVHRYINNIIEISRYSEILCEYKKSIERSMYIGDAHPSNYGFDDRYGRVDYKLREGFLIYNEQTTIYVRINPLENLDIVRKIINSGYTSATQLNMNGSIQEGSFNCRSEIGDILKNPITVSHIGCTKVANDFRMPAHCFKDEKVYVLSKTVHELSTRLHFDHVSGEVEYINIHYDGEEVPLSDNLTLAYGNKKEAENLALVVQDSSPGKPGFNWNNFYNSPFSKDVIFDTQKGMRKDLFSPFVTGVHKHTLEIHGGFTVTPWSIVATQTEEISEGDMLKLLDKEQYDFLNKLNMKFAFDSNDKLYGLSFSEWSRKVEQFVYRDSNFHMLKVIKKYGNHLSMFKEFANNALKYYGELGLTPGVALNNDHIAKLDEISEPIIWPVLQDNCNNANSKFSSSEEENNSYCIFYELYIPKTYIDEAVEGAVLDGDVIRLKVTHNIYIGMGGALYHVDSTDITSAYNVNALGQGEVNTKEETRVIDENGRVMAIYGTFTNHGRVRVSSDGDVKVIATKGYFNHGTLESDTSVSIESDGNIEDKCVLTPAGDVVQCPRNSINGNFNRTSDNIIQMGNKDYVNGSLTEHSFNSTTKKSFHVRHILHDFGYNWHQTSDYFQEVNNAQTITGKISSTSNGIATCIGSTITSTEGGELRGINGTDIKAEVNEGQLHYTSVTKTRVLLIFPSTTTTNLKKSVDAVITPKVISLNPEAAPFKIGMIDSKTTIQGIYASGVVIMGNVGSKLLALELKTWSYTEVISRGFFASTPEPDLSNVMVLRHLEGIEYGDWLGVATGVTQDIVAVHGRWKAYEAQMQNMESFKDFKYTSEAALLLAFVSDMVKGTLSFGSRFTVIDQSGTITIPNQLGGEGTGEVGFNIAGDIEIGYSHIKAKKISGVVLGHLNITSGKEESSRWFDYSQKGFDFTLSLSGLSVGYGEANSNERSKSTKHLPTNLLAEEVVLVVDGDLNLEGAVIDGKKVSIKSRELLINKLVDRYSSSGDSDHIGFGVTIGFSGDITPYVSGGVSSSSEANDLARIISGIRGEEVSVVAEKLTGEIKHIVGRDLVADIKEVDNVGDPVTNTYKKQTSISGSVSSSPALSEDGKSVVNGLHGQVTPSTETKTNGDESRTSLYASSDLPKISSQVPKSLRDIKDGVSNFFGKLSDADANDNAPAISELPQQETTEHQQNTGDAQAQQTDSVEIGREQTTTSSGEPANDNNPCTSGKGVCVGEVYGPEMLQASQKRMSFNEFADEVSNKLKINKQDQVAQDYIREKYQNYLNKGSIEVSDFGMHAHETGILIEQFKQDNPNLSGGIKLAVDVTGRTVGIVADGVVYLLKPYKGVWEVYREFVNDNLVPRKLNEWLVEQENKLRSAGVKWHEELTSKQKLALDTAVETVDFGSNFVAIGAATKTGTKVVMEASYKIGATGAAAEKLLYDSKKGLAYKIANDNFDLSKFEGGLHNGHAIEKHVGKSSEWLKERLDLNPRITGSTSFPDLATANKYTKETLLRNKDAIESWLMRDKTKIGDKIGFKSEFIENTGYGYSNAGKYFDTINEVKVVIKKTEDWFIIYTAHPIVDKVRK